MGANWYDYVRALLRRACLPHAPCRVFAAQCTSWLVVQGKVTRKNADTVVATSDKCTCDGHECEHLAVANALMDAHVRQDDKSAAAAAPPAGPQAGQCVGQHPSEVARRVSGWLVASSNRKLTTFAVAGGWDEPATVTISTTGTATAPGCSIDWRCSHSVHRTWRPPAKRSQAASSTGCAHMKLVRTLCAEEVEEAETPPAAPCVSTGAGGTCAGRYS